jgi:hypothetical protein
VAGAGPAVFHVRLNLRLEKLKGGGEGGRDFRRYESEKEGRCEGEKVEKLKMTEPFLGNGSLILDDGISGTRADSMDPG